MGKGYDLDYITPDEIMAIEGFGSDGSALTEGKSSYQAINMGAFEEGRSNILFIVGAPGSGKSMLSEELGKRYRAKVIHLDNSFLGGIEYDGSDVETDWFDEEFFKAFPAHRKEFAEEVSSLKAGKGHAPCAMEIGRHSYYDDYNAFALGYARKHKKDRLIVEGVQLMDHDGTEGYYMRPLMGRKPSVIFMTTNPLRTVSNMRERDRSWGDRPIGFLKGLAHTMRWRKELKGFRKQFDESAGNKKKDPGV
jgi:hypothetical protein